MPRTEKRAFHASSRISRCLFAAVVAVLLLLALHGGSIAGSHHGRKEQNKSGSVAERHAPPAPQLRSSLGTFSVPLKGSPVLSLQAACRSEMRLYCADHPESPLRCLVERFYDMKSSAATVAAARQPAALSDVCESWLTARDACLSFVHAQGTELCGEVAGDARECLRQIPAVFLPPACVTSDYYESVRLVGRLRQHQTADARLRKIHGS